MNKGRRLLYSTCAVWRPDVVGVFVAIGTIRKDIDIYCTTKSADRAHVYDMLIIVQLY
jgi:hypothetical protein